MTASQIMYLGALSLCLLIATALIMLILFAAYSAWRIYRPARLIAERTPEALGMRYEPLRFPAADGRANLAAWLIHANADTRRNHTVLLCHQWGAHKGVSLAHAKIYCDAGFDVVAFDLRNHGDSDYDPGVAVMSRRFTDDVRGAMLAARTHQLLRDNSKLTVHAFSFSTFPAVVAVADPGVAETVAALILDSGPTPTAGDIMRGFFDTIGVRLLPSIVLLPIVRPVFRAIFTLFALRMLATDWPSEMVRACSVPMLLIGGELDTVARPASLCRTVALLADARLVLLPAKHLTGLRSDPAAYRSAVLSFHDDLLRSEHNRRASGCS